MEALIRLAAARYQPRLSPEGRHGKNVKLVGARRPTAVDTHSSSATRRLGKMAGGTNACSVDEPSHTPPLQRHHVTVLHSSDARAAAVDGKPTAATELVPTLARRIKVNTHCSVLLRSLGLHKANTSTAACLSSMPLIHTCCHTPCWRATTREMMAVALSAHRMRLTSMSSGEKHVW